MEDQQKNIEIDSETTAVETSSYSEYKVYEHPLHAQQIVKVGPCWPALLAGPLYLLYRCLWLHFTLYLVAMSVITYLSILLNTDREYGITDSGWQAVDEINAIAVFVTSSFICSYANEWREENLEKRGFTVLRSIRARSVDEVLAIIERQKVESAQANGKANN